MEKFQIGIIIVVFFKKVKPKDVNVIKGFAELRWEDQKLIKDKVQAVPAKADASDNTGLFNAQYAKSNRSACRGCNEKIEKDELRLSKKIIQVKKHNVLVQWMIGIMLIVFLRIKLILNLPEQLRLFMVSQTCIKKIKQ